MFRYIKKIILKYKVRSEGGEAFSQSIRDYYSSKYHIHIGYGSYGGCFDYRNIPPKTYFGNYCSIAAGVKIFRANHPSNYFTTHPLFYNPIMGLVNEDKLERKEIHIGHDVWIGANVIILPSVNKIGNGAIIGAGTVVTKDVPKYCIVVGNPQRTVRKRFQEETIKKIEKSQWWDLEKKELFEKRNEIEKIVG
jgi:acetyltransferase-like isoleucine patch superfamily enzyme